MGVRYKGNSSYSATGSSPKKPLKIKFNKFVSGQKYYGSKILNFSNGYGDPTLLREKLTYDVVAKYMPSPRTSFASLIYEGSSAAFYEVQLELKTNEMANDWSGMISFIDYINASDNEAFC